MISCEDKDLARSHTAPLSRRRSRIPIMRLRAWPEANQEGFNPKYLVSRRMRSNQIRACLMVCEEKTDS